MPDLLADAPGPILLISSVGERVVIVRGPLRGLSGSIAEVDGDEVLVDLRTTSAGLLVRCQASQLASA